MSIDKLFRSKLGMLIIVIFVTFLWGSAFPFIKLSYQSLDINASEIYEQILFAGYRFFIASVMIFIIMLFRLKTIPFVKGSFKAIFQLGIYQTALQYFFFYIGLSYSTGIQGSIIAGGTGSFFAVILAHYFYENDRINSRKLIGLILGFSGIVIANLTKGTLEIQFGIGELFLLIASFMGALGNVYAKKHSAHLHPLYLTTFQMMLGSLFLIVIGMFKTGFFPFDFDPKSSVLLLYLAFLSASAFALWNTLLKYHKVSSVTIFMFLVPVFGVFLSTILLSETFHFTVLIALVFVITGIMIVNTKNN